MTEAEDKKFNVHHYLDLSTAFLPDAELLALGTEGALDGRGRESGDMPRVISHHYGWWVNVPSEEVDPEGEESRRQRSPALQACIEVARDRGCSWINFDADASDYDPELPRRGL